MSYDFLNSDTLDNKQKQFQSPEPEFRLKQHSNKLPVSSRLFPEWAVACYAVLKNKYPNLSITSMSELIALTMQEFINDNFQRVNEQLPPTEDSLDFLLSVGFINPDNKRQFRSTAKANQKVTEYEAEAMSSNSLKKQYEYWKNRDPEKAEKIMEEITQQAIAGLEQEEKPDVPNSSSKEETVSKENRSDIATPNFLDQMPTEEEED